jgi:two-component system osmolarity sensor histidine kinase EnvZ
VSSIDAGIRGIKSVFNRVGEGYDRIGSWLNARLPKGLYARTLLILLMPIVLLQSVLMFVFMERHWNLVTQRLSAAVSRDIAALIDV